MSAGKLAVLVMPGLILIGAILAMSLLLRRWGLRVAERHPGRWWRRFALLPNLALAFLGAGAVVAGAVLISVFRLVARAAPPQKTGLLADGIANAMNTGAFVALPSVVLYAAAVLAFLAGTFRRSR
ncbi:MAG: hypothetical protein NVS1B3_17690 [Candidatus Dormibacteraceae bacterium]